MDTARITAEYDRRAREIPDDFYSWAKPANLLMHQQTIRSCIAALSRGSFFPLDGLRVADIGCGAGTWLLEFVEWGADPTNLAGIDLIPARLERARQRLPQADLHIGSASDLPWPDESFDLLSQMLVFTNMFDPEFKRAVSKEMLRVLKPGGGILWFDFRIDNPNNPEVQGLRKSEIQSLFPDCEVELKPTLLAPPLSRLIAPRSWVLGEALATLPFLCTHYAGLIRKPGRTAPSRSRLRSEPRA
jgi:ubiquinone/menaquinone biosynthesis C-methylase UbiE